MTKKTYKRSEVARCYRVCFLDAETGRLSQEGRVVMKDLAALGMLEDDTFDENALTMAKNSGAMMMANRIFKFIFTKEKDLDDAEEDVEVEDGDTLIIGNENLNEEIEL